MVFLLWGVPAFAGNPVEIKGDWFYVNGEKFFIKGVNYQAYRPGQSPGDHDKVNLDLVDDDFRLIKEAGFNTIRTAGALTPEIETLAQKHGLFILHGIWFDKEKDYRRPETLTYAQTLLNKDLVWAKEFDNVLGYLFLNEPPVKRVRDAGQAPTEEFLKRLTQYVKTVDASKPVSFANWVPLGFLDHSFLDFIGFNAYIYSPSLITHALGYQGYIQWLKQNLAVDKPLIITEFGLSISPTRKGEPIAHFFGYGGNSMAEQAQGDVQMYDDIIQSAATGACVFLWNDSWWLSGNKQAHEDDNPEKWYGITEYDKNGKAVARPAGEALKKYNQALIIEPQNTHFYSKVLPLAVYATEKVQAVQYKLDEQPWGRLKKNGSLWWQGEINISELADGKHHLEIKALDNAKKILTSKGRDIWVGKLAENAPYKVMLRAAQTKYKVNEKVGVTVSVKDAFGHPLEGQTVKSAIFQAIGWDNQTGDLKTDEKGQAVIEFSPSTPGYVSIAAGVEYQQADGFTQRYGDITVVLIEGNP